MGNQAIYGEGHFISPNKIQRPKLQIDTNKLDIQNFFGKLQIPSTRAQKADDTMQDEIRNSFITRIEHYENSEKVQQFLKYPIYQRKNSALTQLKNIKQSISLNESHIIQLKKFQLNQHLLNKDKANRKLEEESDIQVEVVIQKGKQSVQSSLVKKGQSQKSISRVSESKSGKTTKSTKLSDIRSMKSNNEIPLCLEIDKSEKGQIDEKISIAKKSRLISNLQKSKQGSIIIGQENIEKGKQSKVKGYSVNLEKFMTRNDSPVKDQNKKPQESQIMIFESRIQSKYFKISK